MNIFYSTLMSFLAHDKHNVYKHTSTPERSQRFSAKVVHAQQRCV
jgi:hypothetical protein